MTTDQGYKKVLQRHLKETQDQVTNIQDRLDELGGDTGGVLKLVSGATTLARDAIGQVLVLSKGPLDAVRTPNQQERMLKNAKDECATEALEIATYDALEATAQAAGDTKTAKLAADHRKQEEKMLADLRETIVRLSARTYEDVTGTRAKSSTSGSSRSSSSSSSRRSSSRSTSKRSTNGRRTTSRA